MNNVDLLLEKASIGEVLQDWAFAPGASIRTTWFDGAADVFVDQLFCKACSHHDWLERTPLDHPLKYQEIT